MISNVTDTSQASTASSTGQNSSVSTLDTPFGELFVQNLGSADASIVGYQAANSQTVQTDYPGAAAPSSTTAASSPASTPAAAASTATPAADASVTGTPTGLPTTDPTAVLTPEQVFGDSPWVSDAGGSGPTGSFNLNPMYFASQQTAQTVAGMVGGTVTQVDTFALTPGNPFTQNAPNEMVRLSDGTLINPGLVAGFFTHGYQLSMVEQMIQNEVTNTEAVTKGVTTT